MVKDVFIKIEIIACKISLTNLSDIFTVCLGFIVPYLEVLLHQIFLFYPFLNIVLD